jgi:hypothetical protein
MLKMIIFLTEKAIVTVLNCVWGKKDSHGFKNIVVFNSLQKCVSSLTITRVSCVRRILFFWTSYVFMNVYINSDDFQGYTTS